MDGHTGRRAIAAAALACTASACAADPGFGELPAGAISTSETHGVTAEICRDHLFDPALARARLPEGYRLVVASEVASRQPALAGLLQADPALRSHALGTLCVLSIDRLVVDDAPVRARSPLPVAFWWASAVGPRHVDMRGKSTWVQIGSWYSTGTQDRPAVLKTDPMAEFVDIDIDRREPDRWRLRLVLPGEVITAEVSSSGDRVPSRAAQPGYLSVPMSGPAADRFSVYTYHGHHMRAAQGTWRATGGGVFSQAWSIAGEAAVFGTTFQEGWTSRSGLYRYSAR